MSATYAKRIGLAVCQWRRAQDRSYRWVARVTGYAVGTVASLEEGRGKIETLDAVMVALQLSPGQLASLMRSPMTAQAIETAAKTVRARRQAAQEAEEQARQEAEAQELHEAREGVYRALCAGEITAEQAGEMLAPLESKEAQPAQGSAQ